MKRGAPVLFAAAAMLMGAQGVLACDMFEHATFHTIPTDGWAVGAGMEINTQGTTTTAFTGDVSFKLGEKAVLRPAAGICHSSGSNEAIFGGGVGVNLWNSSDGKLMVNGQSGASYLSSSGSHFLDIPITAAAKYMSSSKLSVFGGAGVEHHRASSKVGTTTFTSSDTPLVLFGGVMLGVGTMNLTGGIDFVNESGGGETSFVAAIGIPMSE
jgi:hypothetical protein